MERPEISICVCTYRRPNLLGNLLLSLQHLPTADCFSYSIVVVDNDPEMSARDVVGSIGVESRIPVFYHHEPVRSISFARNRCVRVSSGDFIAFIDDDEFPEKDWLQNLYLAIIRFEADGVLGPVEPYVGKQTPEWLLKSGLLHRKRFTTGHQIKDSRDTRTGNVILRRDLFNGTDAEFAPKYGLSGGGDADFFHRMMLQGKVFVWCDDAVVYEHVPPERQKLKYYVKRAFTRGLTSAWSVPLVSTSTLRSLVALPVYLLSLPLLLVIGRCFMANYLVKSCDHFGKLLAYVGWEIVKERPYL